MALIIKTSNPSELLKTIRKMIDSKEITTWSYDSDGDFTHTPEQWKNKAWLRPSIYDDALKLGIIAPKDITMSKLIYGIYHGRFIEMLLIHFDNDFDNAFATAQKTNLDIFS